jgi:hypothetical protein
LVILEADRAFISPVQIAVHLDEWLANMPDFFGRHADPGVADKDGDTAAV